MNRSIRNAILGILVIGFLGSGCQKDEDPVVVEAPYASGMLLVNEGNFNQANGTISHYDLTDGVVTNSIFQSENTGMILGDVVQSIHCAFNKCYLVINNSNKVVVVSDAFDYLGEITGLNQPRHILVLDENRAYVSQWKSSTAGDGSIAVVDLNNFSITAEITGVGEAPERMIKVGANEVYLSAQGNSSFIGFDDRAYVLNTITDAVSRSYVVGFGGDGLAEDINGDVWLLCGGKKVYDAQFNLDTMQSTAPSLHRLTPSGGSILEGGLTEKALDAGKLMIDNDKEELIFQAGTSIYKYNVFAGANPFSLELVSNVFYYGIALDVTNGVIYAADAKDFSASGEMIRLRVTDGSEIGRFSVGIIPNGEAVFR